MIPCKYNEHGFCKISSEIAGMPVAIAEDACRACVRDPKPRDVNHVTTSKAIYTLRQQGKVIPRDMYQNVQKAKRGGPGTELKSLLGWFGISESEGCQCSEHASKMDEWGPDKCEANMEVILEWLGDEAAERGVPFVKVAARLLVNRAIKRARANAELDSGGNDRTA